MSLFVLQYLQYLLGRTSENATKLTIETVEQGVKYDQS